MSETPPLLVVDAGARPGTKGLRAAFALGLVAVVLGPGIILSLLENHPFLGDLRTNLFIGRWLIWISLGALGLGFLALRTLGRWRNARGGRVEFRNFAIVFFKGDGPPASLRWTDVAGFVDDSSDFIQLHATHAVYPSAWLTVPTKSDEVRAAVLALLDARGLKRLER